MIVFFGIAACFGLLLVALDFAAWANSPAPSMYRSGVTEWGCILIIVGIIGALCVLPSVIS